MTGTLADMEQHRAELTGYCRRLLRCPFDADDAVQETLVRAWRGYDRFEGRSALRSWLYRIAANVCFDMMRSAHRRASPVEASHDAEALDGDPAVVVESNETIRLAFVAALRRLPARQRAMVILHDVLRWKAAEVAELLGTTAASVNSALQRARLSLAMADDGGVELNPSERRLLTYYVHAFERHDVESLVSVAQQDASLPAAS